MERFTTPQKADVSNNIFTEGLNYFEHGKGSIWGSDDPQMVKLIKNNVLGGKWLNLGSGDGRYNSVLLELSDSLVALDIDKGALSKLWHDAPKKLRDKLKMTVADATKGLPFENETFDGVFCDSFLHMFPNEVSAKIIFEINRVIKSKGKLIFEFATETERVFLGEGEYYKKQSTSHKLSETKAMIQTCLSNFNLDIQMYEIKNLKYKPRDVEYLFSGKILLVVGTKNK